MGTLVIGTIKDHYAKAITMVFLSALFIVVLDTDLRANIRALVKPSARVVLAVAVADLDGKDSHNQVLKVKNSDGIFIEVYGMRAHNGFKQQELIASARLPDKRDGYFTFNGEVTNLAVDDINNDKQLEILATSFDNDLVAHLNVYRYNHDDKELEMVHLN